MQFPYGAEGGFECVEVVSRLPLLCHIVTLHHYGVELQSPYG
jgi:hypothetical protein